MKSPYQTIGRVGVTLLVSAAALYAGWQLWRHYEIEPWTRDGRVKAYVVQVAPDVSGQVTQVYVRDNQQVKAGELLFEIDRARFELALRQAEAEVDAAEVALSQAQREARRNAELDDLVATEAREQGQSRVAQAQAVVAERLVKRDTARLDLQRTRVVSVMNGFVTNLDLRAGSYVSTSHPVMALVDRDTLYVEGYFEETKLPSIHIGDPVAVTLMGSKDRITGHVESFAEGISDRDRTVGTNMLPNINPTFNWVRLAQRIPVRVALDPVPAHVRLVAGQTATVQVLPKQANSSKPAAPAATPTAPATPAAAPAEAQPNPVKKPS